MLFNGPSFGLGFATGFGTGFFSREITKGLQISAKPIAKAVFKTSIQILEKLRETLALAGETFEDLVAEARSELTLEKEPSIAEATARLEKAAASHGKSRISTEAKSGGKQEGELPSETLEKTKEQGFDEPERSRNKKG